MAKEKNTTMLVHVNEWKRSGMSIKAYSQVLGISKNKLEYWIRKFREANNAEKQAPSFINVGSSTDKLILNTDDSKMLSSSTPQLVLTFPNGLCLKIYN
jgi:transposase-like protein